MAARGARWLWSATTHIPRKHPLVFGTVFATAKTSLADFMVQRFVEKRETIDRRRNFMFAMLGFVYGGVIQYYIYVHLFARQLFPSAQVFLAKTFRQKLADRPGQVVVLKQLALDLLVHHPLFFFPTFYMFKEAIFTGDPLRGLAQYRRNYVQDNIAFWKVWVPAQTVNFALCPPWAKIPWITCVSLFWTSVMSFMRGRRD